MSMYAGILVFCQNRQSIAKVLLPADSLLNLVCKTNIVVSQFRPDQRSANNSFNSQLANVLIKSADNRTREHDFKLIKQTCSVDATKYYFTNRVVNVWNSLPSHILLAHQHCQPSSLG